MRSINCESTAAKELPDRLVLLVHVCVYVFASVARLLDYAPFACPIRISRLAAPELSQNKMRSN